jgi:hypothetical protein
MKIVLTLLAALLVSATPVHAQRVYNQAELDALVAPIALHPDGLVSQILIAATYPAEVAAAARWSRAYPHLKGDDAVRAAQGQPWDPSVKALLAFPELLARMDESPQWLHDLGQAFLVQEPHVMDTVQNLRRRAQAAGYLASTDQHAVYQHGEAIVVQPRTHIVYVHHYDPYIVYGPWWWPHYRPVFWRPWAPRPVFVSRGFFYSAPDWHHRHVRVVHRPVHVHQHHHTHVVPGKWQHRNHVVVKPHVRVPEAQRQPIVQSAPRIAPAVRDTLRQPMPAANALSHSTPSPAPTVREAVRQPMPAANAFSHQQRDVREPRSEANHQREHRQENHHRQREHSERRGHRG